MKPSVKKPAVLSDEMTLWIKHNRGVASKIARQFKVSAQFVHQILNGSRHSENYRIERELKKLKCPLKNA